MSAWLLLVRQVHAAGGTVLAGLSHQEPGAVLQARRLGLLEPGRRGAPPKGEQHRLVLTQRGRDFVEGRLGQNAGRVRGTHRHWCATWLAALPRPNEVRLTGLVPNAVGNRLPSGGPS